MLEVRFYDMAEDNLLKFAVIVAQSKGKWVFCKHRERNSYEVAGGHREVGEDIGDTAKRELFEETGATNFTIEPLCVYSVVEKNLPGEKVNETFGMLYYADIAELGPLPEGSEMEQVILSDTLPTLWTYPAIQPLLMEKVHATLMGRCGEKI
jgi:8-oxo-dGTP diphosphatase